MISLRHLLIREFGFRIVPVAFGVLAILAQAQAAEPVAADRLKAVDQIAVQVFGEASLSGSFQVTKSGTLNFPLLGEVSAEGLTVNELAKEIETLLEKDYIRDAQVAVVLVGRKSSSVTVIGQVRRPGPVEFPAGGAMDLFTAVATAGGPLEETADTERIEIKRRSGEAFETIYANLETQKQFPLVDTDTVIVRGKAADDLRLFTVLGSVNKPGTYPMIPGRQLDLLSAIAMAGGINQMGNTKKVTVKSESGESQTVSVYRMQRAEIPSLILKPGDTIFVPESIF